MKILVIYRHFWPDSPPYASMLRSILRELAADGHAVTMWAEQPCYKMADRAHTPPAHETLDGIRVERFSKLPFWSRLAPVRLIDKLLFAPRVLAKALWRKFRGERYDLVWTATIPPVIQGLTGRSVAALFGAKFAYHCQDLYPELGAHSGIWADGGMLHRLLSRIERETRARADLLIALSDDMAATVHKLAAPKGKLAIINNFMLEDFSGTTSGSAPTPVQRNDGKVQLIFAGNLGLFQGLEAIVDAMRLIADCHPAVELVLMGEGKALPTLQRRAAGLANIRFAPHKPFEAAQADIAAADVGIVSLEPDIYRYAFPSKTLTYLGLGLPILVVVEPQSDLARMICDNGLGWVAEARDPAAIARAITAIADESAQLADKGAHAAAWFQGNMDRPVILDQWRREIAALAASK